MKIALRSRGALGCALAVDGEFVGSNVGMTLTGFDTTDFGHRGTGTRVDLNGFVRRAAILPDMSDAALQALTA